MGNRPKSLIVIGPSRIGKTEMLRSFGNHIYMAGAYNLKKATDALRDASIKYAIFDDIEWKYIHCIKGWFGAQNEFEDSDKYTKKKTILWGRPSIFIGNDDMDPRNTPEYRALGPWAQENITFVYLENNKLY